MEEYLTMEEERDTLWQIIKRETGEKFKDHREVPQTENHFSDKANESIQRLRNVLQYIGNLDDVRRLSRMMKELNQHGKLFPEMMQ